MSQCEFARGGVEEVSLNFNCCMGLVDDLLKSAGQRAKMEAAYYVKSWKRSG